MLRHNCCNMTEDQHDSQQQDVSPVVATWKPPTKPVQATISTRSLATPADGSCLFHAIAEVTVVDNIALGPFRSPAELLRDKHVAFFEELFPCATFADNEWLESLIKAMPPTELDGITCETPSQLWQIFRSSSQFGQDMQIVALASILQKPILVLSWPAGRGRICRSAVLPAALEVPHELRLTRSILKSHAADQPFAIIFLDGAGQHFFSTPDDPASPPWLAADLDAHPKILDVPPSLLRPNQTLFSSADEVTYTYIGGSETTSAQDETDSSGPAAHRSKVADTSVLETINEIASMLDFGMLSLFL